jgi:hypothetical protein
MSYWADAIYDVLLVDRCDRQALLGETTLVCARTMGPHSEGMQQGIPYPNASPAGHDEKRLR